MQIDRISELPESILHHILSFLPFKNVAQTSVLSKRWERVWCTYPVLEFDRTIFRRYWDLDKDAQRRRNDVFNCVVETVCNRHKDMISLTKFTLRLPLSDDREFTSFVNQCVCHAIGCNVHKLKLLFACQWDGEYRYSLPQIVLFAKSLEILKLVGCKVDVPRSDLNLSSLRKLSFYCVRIDDHMIKNLFSGCPLIEYLYFGVCEGFKNIELFGLLRLDKVELGHNYGVERLDIKSLNVHSLSINYQDETREINLASCRNLTRLTLCGAPITDEWLHSLISKLPVLEFLSIGECCQLRAVEISSSCLKELELVEDVPRHWIELKIDTPNLRSLYYKGTMISLSLNAATFSKINLHFYCKNVESKKYMEFLANFQHFSEASKLKIIMYEYVMVLGELRQTLSSPLSSLGLLNIRFETIERCFSIAKLVDSLLWIAPHTKIISVNSYGYEHSFEFQFQFSYKKQAVYDDGGFSSCCKSFPISCWHHCIDEVQLEVTHETRDTGKDIKAYSLRGEDIVEKIDDLCKYPSWFLTLR